MFPLLRYFSLTSLLVMSVATFVLWELYRETSVMNMLEAEESRNVALANALVNTLWTEANPVITKALEDPENIHKHPNISILHNRVGRQIAGQSIIKVKMYALNGITFFSTEPSQIGADKSASKGFRLAHDGKVVSELVHKDSIYSLEGVLSHRDLITSYVPARDKSGKVNGVLELYSDITEYLERVNKTQWYLTAGLLGVFITLYALLFMVVLRADRIIRAQEAARLSYQDEIMHRASHDMLTNLPNRAMMKEHLTHALAKAQRTDALVAVLYLDLDGFKAVNDNLGHRAGDELLKTVACRLRKAVRDSDVVCRLGGDEFVVILEGVQGLGEVKICADRIIVDLAEPYIIEGAELSVTASVGISIYPQDGEEMDNVLTNADTAMYAAKEEGKNKYRLYDVSLDRRNAEQMQLRSDLRHALERNQFVLYYQPKLDFHTGKIHGMEALLRWQHPRLGLLPPGKFLPMLEDSDLIRNVGAWVIEEACRQNKEWQDIGLRPVNIAVNVSPRQFVDRSFASRVQEVMTRTGLSPEYLELEVTENVLVKDDKHSLQILHDLKDIGVRLAIDDFGTGFSSLTYLRRFPVDTIKIDRSFVQTMLVDRENAAIVTAVTSLAHGMRLRIVAEGVENEEQYGYLHALRCHEMQGYLFSRPVPAADFEKLLRSDEAIILKRNVPKPVLPGE